MNWLTSLATAAATQPDIVSFNRGIEREALRVTQQGTLSQQPHPNEFGSKLTHAKITTDFSESQLELITPVQQGIEDSLAELDRIHRYVNSHLGDEILWSASMPCALPDDSDIPLAYFGDSNLARLKTTYRSGLGYRYGRDMQTICAIHYNFSFPESFWAWLHEAEKSVEDLQTFTTRRYFDLMRNFRRFSWLLTYLFGASPAVCRPFAEGKDHNLEAFDNDTAYLPYATSLRSGDLGYQSDTQAHEMNICYNAINDYVATLATAISTPHTRYEDIGVHIGDEYRQVNANILQSEAEFYSSIRAKRVPEPGENFLASLKQEGVQYIEVRLLDINPYLPLGIDAEAIRFIDTFLLYCLSLESPFHDDVRCREVKTNATQTVMEGRKPGVMLKDNESERSIQAWGDEILDGVAGFAALLDELHGGEDYQQSLRAQREKIAQPDLTPSGQILLDMRREAIPFAQFAMDQALAHQKQFQATHLTQEETDEFDTQAAASRRQQANIEAADSGNFDEYLKTVADAYLPLRGEAS